LRVLSSNAELPVRSIWLIAAIADLGRHTARIAPMLDPCTVGRHNARSLSEAVDAALGERQTDAAFRSSSTSRLHE